MITQAPKRELLLQFNIDKINQAIKETCAIPGFRILDHNALFNTYRISVVKGLNTALINITLHKASEDSTNCVFEVYNTVGSNLAIGIISDLQEFFLSNLGNVLTGNKAVVQATAADQQSELFWRRVLYSVLFVFLAGLTYFCITAKRH
ncbi:hypothetical protein QTN47_17165 [Danxiaibacter flavus]|uniref:Uncharacterized protein n=1 Tax=Danxiaibacter flavus TaxID=3049108 RepID=A0ABV3ZHD1_9BACT|nr:hypothetical protein QNM32_17175 [Chitinophagaceae bacterium DXS]